MYSHYPRYYLLEVRKLEDRRTDREKLLEGGAELSNVERMVHFI